MKMERFSSGYPQSVSIHSKAYHIFSETRWSFFPFQNNPKNLDLSYKTDLDLWYCLGRIKLIIAKFHRAAVVIYHFREGKTPSYS